MTFLPQTRQNSQVRTHLSTFPECGRTGGLEAHVVISKRWVLIRPSLPVSTQAASKCYRLRGGGGGGGLTQLTLVFLTALRGWKSKVTVWTLLASSKAMLFSLHMAVFWKPLHRVIPVCAHTQTVHRVIPVCAHSWSVHISFSF